MVHRHDCQHDQYRQHRQSGEHKIFLAPCLSRLNMVFVYVFFLYLFQEKKRRNKKGKKEGKKVMSRDKVTEFPLWEPVPQGRGVAMCDPSMTKGLY